MGSYEKLVFISLILIGSALRVKTCGTSIYESSGVIRSPGFPQEYPPELNCIWSIHTAGPLILKITHFSLEFHDQCAYDNLKIWDGDTVSSPLIGTFCGNSIKSPIQSKSNTLLIKFTTDGRKSSSGFEIYFESTLTEIDPASIQHFPGVAQAKNKLSEWLMGHRRFNVKSTNKWGLQAHRIACALYLNDEQLLHPFPIGEVEDELRYELAIQVLEKVSNIDKFSTQEIASFMNGLLVTCLNPRDFYGYDLVEELRTRVDGENYTNPFVILALCNANDTMTLKDTERLESAYSTKRDRPVQFDTQAIAVLALNCIMRKNEALVNVTSTLQNSMIEELIANQAANGTVGSFKDTALVLQALIATNSSDTKFNIKAAVESLLSTQTVDGSFGSFLNSYYILPVFNGRSLVDVSSVHCQEPKKNEDEALDHLKRRRGKMIRTLLSVRIGSDIDLGKTWTLKVPENSSFYDAIELISSMDSKFKIEYSVSDGKPYVSNVSGIEDDPELGLYWLTYVKIRNSSMSANFVKKSPADVMIEENQELILWYKGSN